MQDASLIGIRATDGGEHCIPSSRKSEKGMERRTLDLQSFQQWELPTVKVLYPFLLLQYQQPTSSKTARITVSMPIPAALVQETDKVGMKHQSFSVCEPCWPRAPESCPTLQLQLDRDKFLSRSLSGVYPQGYCSLTLPGTQFQPQELPNNLIFVWIEYLLSPQYPFS